MSTDTSARPAASLRDGDTPAVDAPSGAARKIGGVAGWVDDRTGAAKPVGYLMKKVFPDHWSFMLGEIAMYSMIVCLLTGAFLTF
jgi:ubiquinol-cytochrome c reductase cytochrome b subunit